MKITVIRTILYDLKYRYNKMKTSTWRFIRNRCGRLCTKRKIFTNIKLLDSRNVGATWWEEWWWNSSLAKMICPITILCMLVKTDIQMHVNDRCWCKLLCMWVKSILSYRKLFADILFFTKITTTFILSCSNVMSVTVNI